MELVFYKGARVLTRAFFFVRNAFFLLSLLFLSCCSYEDLSYRLNPTHTLLEKGYEAGFKSQQLTSGEYLIQTSTRLVENPNILYFYIEGDGKAWRNRFEINDDPTPNNPLAFKLALIHAQVRPNDSIIYLARPCQYVQNQACDPTDWTFGRYSEENIAAMTQLVQKFMTMTGSKDTVLIGYSGGAQMALLIAEREARIKSIITVAGVLNHAQWTEYHNVSPLYLSLPAPQKDNRHNKHYCGAEDDITPCHLGQSSGHEMISLPQVDHSHGWQEIWPEILNQN